MAGEQLLIDPTSEATGTQLDITDSTAGYYLLEHDYPDPERDVVYAGSIDTEGDRPAASRPKNVLITATIRCLQPAGGSPSIGTIVKGLQLKIGKLIREGGTFRRVLPSGDTITFDVARDGAHRVTVPADKRWVVRQVADVKITIECTPYGRGAEITLSDHVETTLPVLVFTETGIKGDVPALGRLVVDNDNGSARRSILVWGIQSRYYDSASTSALFFEAESLSTTFAPHTVAAVGAAGASGSTTNKVMRQTSISSSRDEAFRASPFPFTHVGIFNVYVRVQAPATNTGTVSVALEWAQTPDGSAGSILNDAVAIADPSGTPIEGSWVWANLGQVTLPPPVIGATGWWSKFSAIGNGTDGLDWDCVAFIPVQEGSGIAHDVNGVGIGAQRSFQIRPDTALLTIDGSTAWRRPQSYEGDYLRVPPAGQEARTVRVIALMAHSTQNPPFDDDVLTSPAIDDISAQLFYSPRYLAIPEP